MVGLQVQIYALAYNLYNNGAPTAYEIEDADEKCKELMNYLPTAIFAYLESDLLEYCLEAIRIRFEIVKDDTL